MPKDARYFPHDSNARYDDKIRALIKKYKIEGYGRFWIIIETMRDSKGYKIKEKDYVYEALAEQMLCTVEEVKSFLSDCVRFELFVKENGYIYSDSLLERMFKLDTLRLGHQKGAYTMHTKAGHNITKDGQKPPETD